MRRGDDWFWLSAASSSRSEESLHSEIVYAVGGRHPLKSCLISVGVDGYNLMSKRVGCCQLCGPPDGLKSLYGSDLPFSHSRPKKSNCISIPHKWWKYKTWSEYVHQFEKFSFLRMQCILELSFFSVASTWLCQDKELSSTTPRYV